MVLSAVKTGTVGRERDTNYVAPWCGTPVGQTEMVSRQGGRLAESVHLDGMNAERSGDDVDAPKTLGAEGFLATGPAPGTYVLQK